MSRIHRLTTTGTAALAAAALAAAPAAAVQDDLRTPDARDAGLPAVVTPQDGADLRTPDARDAGAGATPVVVRVTQPDTGISWDSAAIGAIAAAGLLISAAGTAGLVSRRRTRPAI